MATSQLIQKQNLWLKSPIVDINHCLNEVIPAFDNLNSKLRLGHCLVDLFLEWFSFNTVKQSDPKVRRAHLNKLNDIYLNVLNNTNTILIIVDAEVKNNVATMITHIYRD